MNNGIQTLDWLPRLRKILHAVRVLRVKGVATGGIQCQQTRFKKLTAIVQA